MVPLNSAIRPYRKENILLKDGIKQSGFKLDLIERRLPDERLQNSLTIDRKDVHFDEDRQLVGQSGPTKDDIEHIKGVFINKYEQTQVACRTYRNRTIFTVTI
jgi:hypothetical protein